MEAIAAAQMDGEVPSMSGSHGNLSESSHHGIVGRELRVMVTTGLVHFTLHFMQRQSDLSQGGGGLLINMSRHRHYVGRNHAKYIENEKTAVFKVHAEDTDCFKKHKHMCRLLKIKNVYPH